MNGEGSTQDWDAYPPGTYVPPPTAQPAYGPPPGYGQVGHGHPGYGQPGYGPPPGYGQLPPYPPAFAATLQWPYGPARPGIATAAAVLGHVTAGLTALVMLPVLLAVLDGDTDPSTVLLLLGIPCAVALVAGAAALLDRRTEEILLRGALASIAVLALVFVVGLATLDSETRAVMAVFIVLALPLPVLTAVFARRPLVRGWVDAG